MRKGRNRLMLVFFALGMVFFSACGLISSPVEEPEANEPIADQPLEMEPTQPQEPSPEQEVDPEDDAAAAEECLVGSW